MGPRRIDRENINPDGLSMFEPVHGSAPKYAGKNYANPIATVLAGAMMLEDLGYKGEADKIERAVKKAVKEGRLTADLGGNLGTKKVGDYICLSLEK